MDRVRSLIGNRRGNNNPRNHNEQLRTPVGTYNANTDDQNTIFDQSTYQANGDDDVNTVVSDMETLDTYMSESYTIGDLQRQGFVNRAPTFNSIRNIPFISILLTRGFFTFPNNESYMSFLENKRKFEDIDAKTGLGIPLFQAIPSNLIKSIFGTNKNESIMKIYKYEIIKDEDIDTNSEEKYDIVQECEGFKVIKFLFCTIYKETSQEFNSNINSTAWGLRIEHILKFYNGKMLKMFNYNNHKDIDTSLDSIPLRWFGFSSFASPFGSNDIKLLILDDNTPNFVNINSNASNNSNTVRRPLGYLPVWAKYSDDDVTVLPKRRTYRLANLQIRETEPANSNASALDVSWNTQVLTCMCMLLHEYESRKERRHNNTTNTS